MNNENIKVLLLDSNSLINRAFHALPPLTNGDGVYTNAVYGYMTMLIKLIAEEKPTHICAVFDCRAKTFRHSIYDKYKGTRKPMAEELAAQIPVLQELLTKLGIKILFREGYEADDILGTLAKRFAFPTLIVSGDRDCLQLVDDTTTVILTKRGITDVKKYTPEVLKEEGFTPFQIIEYKAFAGDSSDNIPGCPGVGEKTAKDLLASYGTVNGVYEHIDEIKGKLQQKLLENKESVYLSERLATIDVNADIKCD
ncbi:MAG: 5'-3' exonuclease H3TH domain-containing protein, partial [Christensenellales bacterium]